MNRRRFKFLRMVSILSVGLLFFVLCVKAADLIDVRVDLTDEKQLIRGFGGMNHPVWISDLTPAQRETAFGNGPGQLGFTILRIHVDPMKSNWYREINTARAAIEHGAIVIAAPWDPPAYMTESFHRDDDLDAKRLRYDMYPEYARHLNDFVTYMRANGVDIYAISIQNEPDYAYEWTWWTAEEIVRFLRDYAPLIDCRIIAPESFQYRKDLSDPILNDPEVLANLDILGAHLYGTNVRDFPYPLFKEKGAGKELWMTEVYYPNSENNSADRWPEALEVAHHIHDALVEGDFQAYVWWYIRRSYGPLKDDGTISKRGYCMAHFSKFVRPGFVRVEATKNPAYNVYVSAYKKGEEVVLVMINKNLVPKTLQITISGLENGIWEKYATSYSRNLERDEDINAAGDSFQLILEPSSVTTIICR